jgi:HPt (histidine-containing phosphotransfer) domain-containing protein
VPPSTFNRAEALQRVGGDAGLLAELARVFLTSCPDQLAELQAALADRDAGRLRCVAHALKGAVGTFGAREAFEAAQRLEAVARTGDLAQAEAAGAVLQEALAALQPAMAALAAEPRVGTASRARGTP